MHQKLSLLLLLFTEGTPEIGASEDTLTSANAVLEQGPMLTNKRRIYAAGKDKIAADIAREIDAQLYMAATRPHSSDSLFTKFEFESEPSTLKLPDETRAILSPHTSESYANICQQRVAEVSGMFTTVHSAPGY